jgi:hypothetical protein
MCSGGSEIGFTSHFPPNLSLDIPQKMLNPYPFFRHVFGFFVGAAGLILIGNGWAQDSAQAPPEMQRWLQPQQWKRSTAEPILTLGEAGKFDDTHIFAPLVIFENGEYWLYYCGSRRLRDKAGEQGKASPPGKVNSYGYDPTVQKERLFKLGLAKSKDGVHFTKFGGGEPVFDFGDNLHSIVTPTILRNTDGTVVRENGKMRMWFAAVDFPASYRHAIHESTSEDGIHWSPPSPPLLKNLYAPCVLRDGETYRMWFCNPAKHPWHIGGAESGDGVHWKTYDKPCIQMDQAWEAIDLVYSSVVKVDDLFVMIYGGYWKDQFYTALGMAVSKDGRNWSKNPHNPVFKPEPSHKWESNYTTSQSLIRLADGTWRLWYASRTAPPFTNLYFAIGTATWEGPGK